MSSSLCLPPIFSFLFVKNTEENLRLKLILTGEAIGGFPIFTGEAIRVAIDSDGVGDWTGF